MAGNEVSAMRRALSSLLTTLTPEQVQNFLQEMNTANAAAVATNSSAMSTPSTSAVNCPQGVTGSVAMSAPRPINTTTHKQQSRTKRIREKAKLRPLNSFMAYRSFYSTVFPDISQKVKSGLLRVLWKSDPFKAKWTILAKSYSIVRDKHPGQVSLHTFLTLNAPIIGIVAPADYIRVMNLQVVVGADNQYSLVKCMQSPPLNPSDLTTNLSADDIVDHCYQTGYVARELAIDETSTQGAGVAMVASVQPNGAQSGINPAVSSTGRSNDSGNIDTGTEITGNDAIHAESGNRTHEEPVDSSQFTGCPKQYHETSNRNSSAVGHGEGPNMNTGFLNGNQGNNQAPPYTPEQFEADLRNAMEQYGQRQQFRQAVTGDDDGYYGLFHPAHQHHGLGPDEAVYNPYRTHNDFNPFDTSAPFNGGHNSPAVSISAPSVVPATAPVTAPSPPPNNAKTSLDGSASTWNDGAPAMAPVTAPSPPLNDAEPNLGGSAFTWNDVSFDFEFDMNNYF